MTDRVPGAPGQYKAVISENNLQKMQAGEEFVITMVRDDQPQIEGTPYSKAAVLPDDLAQRLCPGLKDPTPADAFAALLATAEESTDHPGCYYRMVDGEREWLNPPMEIETEYRTTERYLGKPVFARVLDFGPLPNNSSNGYPITGFGVDRLVFLQGITSAGQLFPFNSVSIGDTDVVGIDVYANNEVVAVITYSNRSNKTAIIIIKYTKV